MAYDLTVEEENISKKISFSAWGKVFKYIFKYWYLILILLFLVLLTAFYDTSFIPMMNKAAITSLGALENAQVELLDVKFNIIIFNITFPSVNLIGYGAILGIGILLRALTIGFTFFITNYLEMSVMTSLRRDAFNTIQQLSFSYYDKTPSGWLIARTQNDASTIGEMLSWGVIRIIWSVSEIFFTVITMFTIDWMLSLMILGLSPFVVLIVFYFNNIILKRHRISRNAYSNYVRWLAECISGVKTIKILSIEDVVYDEANDVITDVQNKKYKAHIPNAFFTTSFNVLSAITVASIMLLGIYVLDLGSSAESIATLVVFIGFVGNIYNPLADFSEIFSEFVATQASIEKITSLINTTPEIKDREEVIKKYGDIFNNKIENFEPMVGNVYFNHVSFSYLEGTEILHDLDLYIKKGTSVAIVGETGSGKSTTVNLLCRFYEPTQGKIEIDGLDYKDRSLGWLRSNIGFVQQTPFIFSESIEDNIRYGKLDASEEEIINACKIVGIHEFIESFKDGYKTVLKESGSELSVGQKQLLSFARAIIRNPKIMILDEATSSIDTETEKQIQDAMINVLKDRTSLIIAHRLSTIVDCDRILVMKDGKVIEDGNHSSLLNKKGYYYNLYMNQFRELDISKQIETFENQVDIKAIKI